jgi:hypothetical protein
LNRSRSREWRRHAAGLPRTTMRRCLSGVRVRRRHCGPVPPRRGRSERGRRRRHAGAAPASRRHSPARTGVGEPEARPRLPRRDRGRHVGLRATPDERRAVPRLSLWQPPGHGLAGEDRCLAGSRGQGGPNRARPDALEPDRERVAARRAAGDGDGGAARHSPASRRRGSGGRRSTRVRPSPFDRFTRSPESRGRTDGSGLGLAIAQAYARAHGGDIVYEPGVPHGARFELVLPVRDPETRQPGSAPRLSASPRLARPG